MVFVQYLEVISCMNVYTQRQNYFSADVFYKKDTDLVSGASIEYAHEVARLCLRDMSFGAGIRT